MRIRNFLWGNIIALLCISYSYGQNPQVEGVWVNGNSVNHGETITINLSQLSNGFEFKIEAMNGYGNNAHPNSNSVTIAFPQFTNSNSKGNISLDASNTHSDLENLYTEVFGTAGGDGYAEYLIVETGDENGWQVSEQNSFGIHIAPNSYGNFEIKYRLAMSSTGDWNEQESIKRDPDLNENYDQDALGFPAYSIFVNIVGPEPPEPPEPKITLSSLPDKITLGESITVQAEVNNNGGDSPTGGITFSFPDMKGSNDKQFVSSNSSTTNTDSYSEYDAGETINTRTGQTSASYLMVEGGENNWSSSSSRKLSVNVTPQQAGTFRIYVRSAMQGEDGNWYNEPSSGSQKDQQDWPVEVHTVIVDDPTPILDPSVEAVIVTVDGLDPGATFNGTFGDGLVASKYNNYLGAGIINMNFGSKIKLYPFPWNRDASSTDVHIERLQEFLVDKYRIAKNNGKKFIVISHSWGTFLSYIALAREARTEVIIEADLYITMGSPLGTTYVGINGVPNFTSEVPVIEYVDYWLEKLNFDDCSNCFPKTKRFLNYWAWGDIISGPLNEKYSLVSDIKVDSKNLLRNFISTPKWHDYTTLREKNELYFKVMEEIKSILDDFIEPPKPKLAYDFGSKSEIKKGESLNLKISSTNIGGLATYGSITLSLPDVSFEGDIGLNSSGSNNDTPGLRKIEKGQNINHRDDDSFNSNYLVLEYGDDSWTKGEKNVLNVEITPKQIGEFTIFLRSNLGNWQNNTYYNTPLESEQVDQQGWPVIKHSVLVEPTANSSPIVSIVNGPADGKTINFNDPGFSWNGDDPDGPETIAGYEVELQGSSDTSFTTTKTTHQFDNLSNGEYTFRVRAKDNEGAYSLWDERSFTVDVAQGGNTLTVSPTSISFEASAKTKSFSIISNVSWSVSDDKGWITINPTSGSNDGDVDVSVEANPNTTKRNGIVAVSGGEITREVAIEQEGTDTPTNLKFAATTSTFTENDDLNKACRDELGSSYRLADWTEIEAFYQEKGSLSSFFDAAKLDDQNGKNMMVQRNSNRWYSSSRQYFISRHDGNKPSNFAAHDNINNYELSLGSWYGLDQRVLCFAGEASNNSPTVSIDNGPPEGNTISFNNPSFVWSGEDSDGSVEEYEVDLQGPSASGFSTKKTSHQFSNLSNGNYTFRVQAIDNEGSKSSWAERNFTVKVEEKTLSVNPDKIPFEVSASTKSFNVSSNVSWSVNENISWLSVSPSSGSDDGEVEISVEANPKTTKRNGTVEISGGGILVTVNVEQQEAEPILAVSPSNMSYESSKGRQNASVNSNISWSISKSEDWISVSPTSGSNDAEISVTVETNSKTFSRNGSIEFSGGGITRTITIDQEGADPVLSVSPSSLGYESSETKQSFNVSSNVSWSVSDDKDWISVSPAEGSGDGEVSVTLEVNTSTSSRSGTVEIKGGDITRTIGIEQAGEGVSFSVSPSTLSYESSESKQTFSISSNISWSVSEEEEWISVNPTSGSDDSEVSVSVEANSKTTKRSGTVEVSGGGITRTISIEQEGADVVLTVSPSSLEYESSENTQTFSINSNASWSVSDDQGWISVSPTNGTGDEEVEVSVQANSSADSRSGKIEISSGDLTRTIKITQTGEGVTLTITPSSLSYGPSGSSKNISISSNVSWNVSGNKNWISVSPSSGSNDGEVNVSVEANTSTSSRSGEIEVSGGNISRTITIDQAGDVSITSSYSKGWNLVSIPEEATDKSISDYFPSVDEEDVFEFEGQYAEMGSLISGKGYWVKLEDELEVEFNGSTLSSLTLTLKQGWNLIGTVADTLNVPADLVDQNNILESGTVWKSNYNSTTGKYELAETDRMLPGRGYFIKAAQSGEITLSKQ